jgi:hypothetical protein
LIMPSRRSSDFNLDLDSLLKKNKNVDADQVRQTQDLLEELRKHGLARPHYDLVSPYERRPSRRSEEETDEVPRSLGL